VTHPCFNEKPRGRPASDSLAPLSSGVRRPPPCDPMNRERNIVAGARSAGRGYGGSRCDFGALSAAYAIIGRGAEEKRADTAACGFNWHFQGNGKPRRTARAAATSSARRRQRNVLDPPARCALCCTRRRGGGQQRARARALSAMRPGVNATATAHDARSPKGTGCLIQKNGSSIWFAKQFGRPQVNKPKRRSVLENFRLFEPFTASSFLFFRPLGIPNKFLHGKVEHNREQFTLTTGTCCQFKMPN
jgi:hypothetical protein